MLAEKMRARRRRRLRTVLTLLLLVALTASGVYLAASYVNDSEILTRERCSAVVGTETYELAPDQAANASLISGVGVARGLPARAVSIALATAAQESGLRNLEYGDDAGPDSRGLFQQRPSQGWGTEEQVQDPLYAAGAFYDALEKIPDYQSMTITQAAQAVQRSAFPEAYADHEPEARAFASALTGNSPASLNCVLRKPETAGDPAAVEGTASSVFGSMAPSVSGQTLTLAASGSTGWAAAQWAVANAKGLSIDSVSYSGLQWTRAAAGWRTAETNTGQIRIDVSDGAESDLRAAD